MIRAILIPSLIALTMAGCASGNPMAPSAQSGFDTKLLNLFSIGEQVASQTNYVPNTQLNVGSQNIGTNVSAMFPIASAIGTGAATGTSTAVQTIANTTVQTQAQTQLVL